MQTSTLDCDAAHVEVSGCTSIPGVLPTCPAAGALDQDQESYLAPLDKLDPATHSVTGGALGLLGSDWQTLLHIVWCKSRA
jgi:hypothetical protein